MNRHVTISLRRFVDSVVGIAVEVLGAAVLVGVFLALTYLLFCLVVL